MDRRLIAAVDLGHASIQAALFEAVGLSLRLLGLVRMPTPLRRGDSLGDAVAVVLRQLAVATRISLLDEAGSVLPPAGGGGADAWYLTTDCGGPIRVAVAGVIDDISGQSALKAALRSGAAIGDLLAINDGRLDHEKARDLRRNPVDLIVLAGGVDEGLYAGGGGRQVVGLARTIAAAAPRTRYDPARTATVVFAGSTEARPDVERHLAPVMDVVFADNVRPDLALENLASATQAILDVFRNEVVAGEDRWRGVPAFAGRSGLVPSGFALATAAELAAASWRSDVLVADISECQVNMVTVIGREVNRTVADEIGLNFDCPESIGELTTAALNWVPADVGRDEAANILGGFRVRPASVPQTWTELMIQQGAVRERLRVGLDSHRMVAALVKGIRRQRNIDEIFGAYSAVGGQTIVDLTRIDTVLMTGRLVSAAVLPGQILAMALDGIGPQGITQVLADRDGLLPHLGAMAGEDEALVAQVLSENWFERLALVVAPVPVERGGPMFRRQGAPLANVRIEREAGSAILETVDYGTLKRIPLEPGEIVRVTVQPGRGYNAGAGFGATAHLTGGGTLGVVLDGRGRPIILPNNPVRRRQRVGAWLKLLEAYPEPVLAGAVGEAD